MVTPPAPPRSTPLRPVVRRVQSARPADDGFSVASTLQTVLSIAVLIATLFTMWNPANLFTNNLLDQVFLNYTPIDQTTSVEVQTSDTNAGARIGIVIGHYSTDPDWFDPGAVCADGLTEVEVNYAIASLVQQRLVSMGYTVDLLQEFDTRLDGYEATLLVSIHNDSCEYGGDDLTGFKAASSMANPHPEDSQRLVQCLIDRYGTLTGLPFHYNTITDDMRSYHAFDEVGSNTVSAIIETGFLNLDRDFLTSHTDIVAEGIVQGILCYLRNEAITTQTTPVP
ncbi:MAG TPA: N-acetylmuramoyl-L-alanine amidase [Longilinea sp.]|nr:N-acetylmuramoyl-L-alanine amidase [Longilinea sp.]